MNKDALKLAFAAYSGPTYTPPKRPWVGLTDEKKKSIYNALAGNQPFQIVISDIEAKLKELNT